MSVLATIEDFEARHGDVSEADEATVETLLADASTLVLSEISGTDADWHVADAEADPPVENTIPDLAVVVVVGVAYRAWKNPAGVASESLGAASVTYSDASSGVWLTDRERRLIKRAAGSGSFASITLESPYSGDSLSDLDFDPDAL